MELPPKLRRILPLCCVLFLTLAVSLHFCLWKGGMFIDEIYSFGLANSHCMPFIGHGEQDRIAEQVITREDFQDYLTVTDSEPRFDAASVYYNQVRDVHPPLYYWILNFCSSLVRGTFSKWIGLIPGLILFLGTVALLYVLAMELWDDRSVAAGVAALYGLSRCGLSVMLLIRMYGLMSLLTVLLALMCVRELKAPALKREVGIGLTIFLGLMTQYYYVFYAFFLCAAVVIVLLLRRAWKPVLRFAACAFAGVAAMLLCFPAVFEQMSGQRLGPQSDAMENLRNISAWAGRLRYYFGQLRLGLPAAVLISFLALAVWAAFALRRKEGRLVRDDLYVLILILPVVPTILVAALISPVLEGRYIYNIMPICVLAAGFCLAACLRHIKVRLLLPAVLLACTLLSLRTVPDYLYPEQREYSAALAPHADAPCVYLTEYYAGVTQDMLQLELFEDVCVTSDPASDALAEYLDAAESDELVVYIDIDSFWGSGYNAAEMLSALESECGYQETQHLYQYALSDTYLLRR